MKRWMTLASVVLPVIAIAAKPKVTMSDSAYYIYQDKGSKLNHYIPSGWMGDYGDIKFDDNNHEDCVDGISCIKITYTAKASQGNNWAGIYWMNSANNWGKKPGFNMNGYKQVTFWARGATGNEIIDKFQIGGITGDYNDTGNAALENVKLSKSWQKYTIELKDPSGNPLELSSIAGGFCWVANRDINPDGIKFYLDEIRYEK